MDKTAIIILIIAVLVSLVLGAGIGFFYKMTVDAPKLKEAEKMSTALQNLSSGLVPSIVAYGEVSDINGRNITLTYNGKTMQIAISNDAKIYSSVPNTGSTVKTLPMAKISDIKKGDRLNITMKVSPEGSLQGQSIIIIGSSTAK